MKIGIMGGTFDPIHIGHLIAAETARESAGLDEVWFMPAHTPPHKAGAQGAGGEQRLEMVRLAVENNPRFRPFGLEIDRGGVSYTADTVKRLKAEYPEHGFAFIIGADMVNDLPRWRRIEEIVQNIAFIGLNRPGHELGPLPELLEGKVRLAPMPVVGISSTEIRSRLQQGLSVRYQVPAKVYHYIREHGLYESGNTD